MSVQPAPAHAGMRYVSAEDLRAYIARLFAHEGLTDEDARTVADCLVSANLRGVDTHGIFRAPTYLKRLREGLAVARPTIRIDRIGPSITLVDGGNGMGAVVATRAMASAINCAKETGIGLVSVRNSSHYGMAAYYVLQAIAADVIGLAFTNASPALPPWGGRAPFFGTSPLAVGVPAGTEHPYVLDMAMSVLARGNVYLADKRAMEIPPGLALDAQGRPTTDPRALIEGGTMLPFGGVKGAALAMLMDILGGVLSGAAFAGNVGNPHMDFDRPQNVGHLFICIRPDLFMPIDEFRSRMDHLVKTVKAQPRAEGFDEILMPGERESRTQMVRSRSGLPLPQEVADALEAEGRRISLPFPRTTASPTDAPTAA